MTSKFITPRLRVGVATDASTGTGEISEYDIQTDNRDAVRYDMLRSRKGFPLPADAHLLWITVLAWSCLAREGKIGADVEKAIGEEILYVVPIDEDGNPIQAPQPNVDPTQTDH